VENAQDVEVFIWTSIMRGDGGPNRFFCNIFNYNAMAIEFLQNIGLLRKTMQCDSCGPAVL
jgi:hypothetical protein